MFRRVTFVAMFGAAAAGTLSAQNLVASNMTTSKTSWQQGDRVELSARVRNASVVRTSSVRSGFYFSTNSTITASDLLLRAVTTPGLGRLSQTTQTTQVSVPKLPRGSVHVGFFADDRNRIRESNEDDNTVSTPIRSLGGADLTIDRLAIESAGHRSGGKIQVRTQIRNSGQVSTGPFVSGVLLSTDNRLSSNDTLIGVNKTRILGANGLSTHVQEYPIPLHLRSGQWHVIVVADMDSEVSEISESNNVATNSTLIGRPTLGAAAIEYMPRRNGPRSMTTAEINSNLGAQVDIAVTDTLAANGFYLCYWTCGSNSTALDACTDISISLLNTPVFIDWFGRLGSQGHGHARFRFPRRTPFDRRVFTHFASFRSDLSLLRVTGSVEMSIRSQG